MTRKDITIDELQAQIRGALRLADDLRLYDVAARLDSARVLLSHRRRDTADRRD